MSKADDKILALARKRMNLAAEAELEIRKCALDDLRFRAGEQWDEAVKNQRQRDGRPVLTINRLPQFLRQVQNDQRQNKPSIKVKPADDKADIETAKVYQGVIRNIEYNSNADNAYDTAFAGATSGGFGYFRIATQYCNNESFDQEIKIKRIRDPFSVYFDPTSQEPDGSDANWAFIVEDYSKDEYDALYPDSKVAKTEVSEFQVGLGDNYPRWFKDADSVRVTEYFYKEMKKKTLVMLDNGAVFDKEMLAPELYDQIKDERDAMVPVVKWCKMNGAEILESTDWPGTYIPIVPVYGDELYIDGKRYLEGVIRHAKDPQRMYNFWASAETETIALAPKAPFIAAEGQIEPYKRLWDNANRANLSVLPYKPQTLAGVPVPPPQRSVQEAPVQAITQARMLASEDMKATTGIYDAGLGNQSNETSGVAIQRRNIQAQTSNFHFVDNLSRSLRHAGRILVEIIPIIYDSERIMRIIGEDDEERVVRLNAPFDEKGKQVEYNMAVGKYDVVVETGPSFATKRQEAVSAMLEVVRAYPQLAQFAGDLLVKNMDWPGAAEFAERLKKTVPPELRSDEEGGSEVPPQVQAQMQQAQMMVEQLTQQLNDAQDQLEKKKLEFEHEERMQLQELQTKVEIERAKLDSRESQVLLSAEIKQLEGRLAMMERLQSQEQSLELEQNTSGGQDAFAGEPTGGPAPGTYME